VGRSGNIGGFLREIPVKTEHLGAVSLHEVDDTRMNVKGGVVACIVVEIGGRHFCTIMGVRYCINAAEFLTSLQLLGTQERIRFVTLIRIMCIALQNAAR